METLLRESFREYYLNLVTALPQITFAILVLLVIGMTAYFASRYLEKRLMRRKGEPIIRIFLVNVLRWSLYIWAILAAMDIMGWRGLMGGFMAGAGVSAIILGFAFKDIIENFLAGILLAFSRPFRTGDIIEVEKFRGRVQNMELRTTHIRNMDGRDIFLPNSMIMKNALTNFTRDGLLRHQFTFGVDTPTDTDALRRLIMNSLFAKDEILSSPRPTVSITELAESNIVVRVAFWVNLFKGRDQEKGELGEPILSRTIDMVRKLMIENNINMPGKIVELKNYDSEDPLTFQSVTK